MQKDIFHQRLTILSHKEEMIRLKSRDLWLEAGDENTKFLNNFSNRRILSNSIQESVDSSSHIVIDQDSIKEEAISYFFGLYKDLKSTYISNQIEVLKLYPTMFFEEEGRLLEILVLLVKWKVLFPLL